MSALPPEADMLSVSINVRYVPIADIQAVVRQTGFLLFCRRLLGGTVSVLGSGVAQASYSWGRSPGRYLLRGIFCVCNRLPHTFCCWRSRLIATGRKPKLRWRGHVNHREVSVSTIQICSSVKRSRISAPTALAALLAVGMAAVVMAAPAVAQEKKPNILVIMGDDVGWFNIGAYHQGIMSGKTPNLDKLASQGMRFTDYYAEASCTAGRANFITGELPIRTGLTTVGQAGADVGITGSSSYACHCPQILGLCNWTVREKPPGRLEQVSALCAWLR